MRDEGKKVLDDARASRAIEASGGATKVRDAVGRSLGVRIDDKSSNL